MICVIQIESEVPLLVPLLPRELAVTVQVEVIEQIKVATTTCVKDAETIAEFVASDVAIVITIEHREEEAGTSRNKESPLASHAMTEAHALKASVVLQSRKRAVPVAAEPLEGQVREGWESPHIGTEGTIARSSNDAEPVQVILDRITHDAISVKQQVHHSGARRDEEPALRDLAVTRHNHLVEHPQSLRGHSVRDGHGGVGHNVSVDDLPIPDDISNSLHDFPKSRIVEIRPRRALLEAVLQRRSTQWCRQRKMWELWPIISIESNLDKPLRQHGHVCLFRSLRVR